MFDSELRHQFKSKVELSCSPENKINSFKPVLITLIFPFLIENFPALTCFSFNI